MPPEHHALMHACNGRMLLNYSALNPTTRYTSVLNRVARVDLVLEWVLFARSVAVGGLAPRAAAPAVLPALSL